MDSITPEEKQSVLAAAATELYDDLPESEDVTTLEDEIADLEKKMSIICANPSLKLQVLQKTMSNQDGFLQTSGQNSKLDENLLTEEEKAFEDTTILLMKSEQEQKAESSRLENDFLKLQSTMIALKAAGPVETHTEPRDMTRMHHLHKENVRLANILTVMAAERQLDPRRQKKIELLCNMVHSKNYSSDVQPNHDAS